MKTSEIILFDTNVLVYNQDRNSKFYQEASAYHNKAFSGEIKGAVTVQNFLEFSAVMINPRKIVRPLTQKLVAAEIRKYIQSRVFNIVVPNEKTLPVFISLLKKYKLKNPRQVFDLFLAATMISNDIFCILTANVGDFAFKEIKVINL